MTRHSVACLTIFCLLTLALPYAEARSKSRKVVVLVEKVYPIADLIVPIAMDVEPNSGLESTRTLERELMSLIACCVAPESWHDNGGLGTMQYFPIGMSLVVRQSDSVHARLQSLLADLRRPQEVEVSVELRLVSVSPRTARAMAELAGGTEEVCLLSDAQVFELMKGAQGDRKTQIMQAPKITVGNGQRASLKMSTSEHFLTGATVSEIDGESVLLPKNEPIETGIKYTVRPVVAEDRHSIDLSVCISLSQVDGPVTLIPWQAMPDDGDGRSRKTGLQVFLQQPKIVSTNIDRVLKIPPGQSALIDAGVRLVETRHESAAPVVSRIPYVNRLFRNIGYGREAQHLFVMVTPRLIEQHESTTAANNR
jgi:Flp pilus assembly secretin CpaC